MILGKKRVFFFPVPGMAKTALNSIMHGACVYTTMYCYTRELESSHTEQN